MFLRNFIFEYIQRNSVNNMSWNFKFERTMFSAQKEKYQLLLNKKQFLSNMSHANLI